MKKLANLLMVLGAIVAVVAFTMDVTVGGSGIVNMNLMAQRQNLLIVGCVGFLAGVVMLVGGQRPDGSGSAQQVQEYEKKVFQKATERLSSAGDIVPSLFEKYVLKGESPEHFWVKFIGGLVCATVSAFLAHKIVSSLAEFNFFPDAMNMAIWDHTELFYVPSMVLTFVLAMRTGFSTLLTLFYLELLLSVIWPLIFIVFLDVKWAVMLYFSLEAIVCAIGAWLIRSFVSKRVAVPA